MDKDYIEAFKTCVMIIVILLLIFLTVRTLINSWRHLKQYYYPEVDMTHVISCTPIIPLENPRSLERPPSYSTAVDVSGNPTGTNNNPQPKPDIENTANLLPTYEESLNIRQLSNEQ